MTLVLDLSPVQRSWTEDGAAAVSLLTRLLADRPDDAVVVLLAETDDPDEVLRVRGAVRGLVPARDVRVVPRLAVDSDGPDDRARQDAARHAVLAAVGSGDVLMVDRELLVTGELEVGRPSRRPAPDGMADGSADVPRRSLALISPLPPARSGVADFAAATLGDLAERYDVTVVSDTWIPETPDAVTGSGAFAVMTRSDFHRDWWTFDRVVYHVGNNALHADDLELLVEAPGVLVVHDAVLSGAIRSAPDALGHPGGTESLLEFDGPDPRVGAVDLRGTRAAVAPALGILVHSEHAREVLREAGVTTPLIRVSPLPVTCPAATEGGSLADLDGAKVLAHFGFVNAFKGAEELVEAAGELRRRGVSCRVAFVGDFLDRDLRRRVTAAAQRLGVPVDITGFVDGAEWTRWLARAACAVQLRQQSHGESSAAVGELLVSGLPVICSDVGSFAELPEGVVRHVPQGVTGVALADVIAEVLQPEQRRALGSAARRHAQTVLAPEHWAGALGDLLEEVYATGLGLAWSEAARGLPAGPTPDLIGLQRPVGAEVWLSDVSVYAHTPFFSGIQRVTVGLHRELCAGGTQSWLFPTSLVEEPVDDAHPEIAQDPLLQRAWLPLAEGDWLLAIDLDVRLARIREQVLRARARGLRLAVFVYDILPVRHPEWFPRESGPDGFGPWLRMILQTADLLVVNSMATADDLRGWVEDNPPDRIDPMDLALLRLGSEFPADAIAGDAEIRHPEHFLMVGTVEPRKGHADVLNAFEKLWQGGSSARLTIVGRAGWMVTSLVRRMEHLRDTEERFQWLTGATDDDLRTLYARCTAVIMASEGEGFGLPVIEAAAHGCPAVIRDLPVFREIMGVAATYFRADGADLVEVLERVASASADCGLPTPSTEHIRPWSEVASRFIALLDGQEPPLDTWTPDGGWTFDQTPTTT